MLDYAALSAVDAVIREGSFERAAQYLNITPSAVSQRVRGLEDRLGAMLVIRAQPCTATDLGRTLCAHLDRVRLLEHDLGPVAAEADGRAKPVTLRIAVNADSLATWFPRALARCGELPGVSLDIQLDDEAHTVERFRSGEVIAAVTSEARAVPGCVTTYLGTLRYVACASPGYVATHFPNGVTGEALSTAPSLYFDRRDTLQSRWSTDNFGVKPGGPTYRVPSTHGFRDLAVAGMGWGMHPTTLVREDLAQGMLQELARDTLLDVALYWIVPRLPVLPLQTLTEAVHVTARGYLDASG